MLIISPFLQLCLPHCHASVQVEHLLTENERITAKEGGQGGLTEGQQAQLARNDKAITGVRLQASGGAAFVCLL